MTHPLNELEESRENKLGWSEVTITNEIENQTLQEREKILSQMLCLFVTTEYIEEIFLKVPKPQQKFLKSAVSGLRFLLGWAYLGR